MFSAEQSLVHLFLLPEQERSRQNLPHRFSCQNSES